MRNACLVLLICGLQLCEFPSVAAEKTRDWKTGQIVESDQASGSLLTIASPDRNYLVKGTIGTGDQPPAVGTRVRFALEGKTMFVSLAGKEYRLYVMGERVATPPGSSVPAPSVVVTPPAPPPVKPAPPAVKSPEVPKPETEAVESLDNDAIVKMMLGGLKEDTIVRVIETRPGKYILTKDALTGLRAAGVPQSVIAAMSAKMTGRH